MPRNTRWGKYAEMGRRAIAHLAVVTSAFLVAVVVQMLGNSHTSRRRSCFVGCANGAQGAGCTKRCYA